MHELLRSPFRTKEVKVLGEELVVFRDPEENDSLDVPVIPNEGGEWVGAPRAGNFTYHPQETGYSRDADKIEAVMATWQDLADELRRRGL
jgi:hypothetical protein